MLRARNRFADSVRRLYGLRRRFPQVALFACVAAMAGIAGYGRAEDEILKLVPEQALGFVVVNRPAAADAKLQQLGREMKLPIPSLLAKLEGPGGIRAGLDKKRPIALLVLPPKDKGIPAAIVLVPVSDYAKFLEQFKSDDTEAGVTKIELWGSASLVRKVGSYAAISGPPVSREALQDVKLADEVPAGLAPWRTWLAKEDAAAVILAPGIRSLSDKVQQGINAVKPVLAKGGDQMKQAAAALDMYVMFFQTAEKEVASFGLGVERDAQGVVRLTKRIRLVAGGKWASFVADMQPSKQDALAGLPNEPFVVAAGGPLSEAAMRKLMDASFALIKSLRGMYGLSEEQAQAISELGREKFPGIRGVSFVLGAGQGSETMFARMLGVMRVDNSETFLADYEKYLARYNRVVEKIKSPMFQPMQCEKTEMGGARALKITMKVPQMPNMPPESAKLIEKMYGPGGKIVDWIVPCNEDTVVFSYMDQGPLQKAIAAIKQGKPGLAGNAEVAKVAALLPPGATWCLYFSPSGMFDFLKRAMAMALPPGSPVKIPEFGPTPPIAMAVTTGPDEVECHTIVPAEVLKEIGRLITTLEAPPPAVDRVEEVPER